MSKENIIQQYRGLTVWATTHDLSSRQMCELAKCGLPNPEKCQACLFAPMNIEIYEEWKAKDTASSVISRWPKWKQDIVRDVEKRWNKPNEEHRGSFSVGKT